MYEKVLAYVTLFAFGVVAIPALVIAAYGVFGFVYFLWICMFALIGGSL